MSVISVAFIFKLMYTILIHKLYTNHTTIYNKNEVQNTFIFLIDQYTILNYRRRS